MTAQQAPQRRSATAFAILFAILAATAVALFLFLSRSAFADRDLVPVWVLAQDVGAGQQNDPVLYRVEDRPPTTLPSTGPLGLMGPGLVDGQDEDYLERLYNLEFRYPMRAGSVVDVATHLGRSFALHPDERGIALTVDKVSGIAGFIAPGDRVSILASLQVDRDDLEAVYAKMLFDNLRILYVEPNFQRRLIMQAPNNGEAGDATEGDISATGTIVVAASLHTIPIVFKHRQTMMHEWFRAEAELRGWVVEGEPLDNPFEERPPEVQFGSQVEIIAALQRADAQFSLMLQPQPPYELMELDTPGFTLSSITLPLELAEREFLAEYDLAPRDIR